MNEIIIYKNKKENVEIELNYKENSLWLDAHKIANLFNVQRPAIVKHIGNIYKSSELDKNSTCSILEQVAGDSKRRKISRVLWLK